MPTLRLKRRWGMVFLKPCPDAIAYGLEFITPSNPEAKFSVCDFSKNFGGCLG
jgi:hypothetical protein